MRLADRLREVRNMQGYTLKDLAARSGLSVSYLSDLERGRTIPALATLEQLSGSLGFSLVDLLAGVDIAGDQTDAGLPPGLAELKQDDFFGRELTQDWIKTLSAVQFRGNRPQSREEWLELFLHLKRMLEPPNDTKSQRGGIDNVGEEEGD